MARFLDALDRLVRATINAGRWLVLPVLVLFLSLQRYYIRGILMGSVKG